MGHNLLLIDTLESFKYKSFNAKTITKVKNTEGQKREYDLEERTAAFGRRVIRLAKALPNDVVNTSLKKQAVRSGTSIGANYREACEAASKKDFIHKIRLAKKEARETTYWIEMIAEANLSLKEKLSELHQESKELTYILAAIVKSTTEGSKKVSSTKALMQKQVQNS